MTSVVGRWTAAAIKGPLTRPAPRVASLWLAESFSICQAMAKVVCHGTTSTGKSLRRQQHATLRSAAIDNPPNNNNKVATDRPNIFFHVKTTSRSAKFLHLPAPEEKKMAEKQTSTARSLQSQS